MADVLSSFLRAHEGRQARRSGARWCPSGRAWLATQISAVTEPIMITRDGTLFVTVKTSSWMSELSLMEPQLLAAINAGAERAGKCPDPLAVDGLTA